MPTNMRARGRTARAMAFSALATIIAPHLAFAESGVANVDSINKSVSTAKPAKSGVSDRSTRKIGTVIATLKDILQSVDNEEKAETTIFSKYSSWCKTQEDNLATDLSNSKDGLQNSQVLSEEQASSIDSLKLFMAKSKKEEESTKDAMAQAENLRKKEKDQYDDDMLINTQSLAQIEAAIKHVGKVQPKAGFLQSGAKENFHINLPGESSYVLGVMKGLKEKLEKTRKTLKAAESEKEKMHTNLMQTKGQELKLLQDAMADKKILLTETGAKQSGVQRKIGRLTEQVTALTDTSAKTNATCLKARQSWKVRQEDRSAEKHALKEAIQYVTKTSFLQLSSVQQEAKPVRKESVLPLSFLQNVDSDTAFEDVADRAFKGMTEDTERVQDHLQKGAFNGVKSIVSKLIENHNYTQYEEKKKKAYCEGAIASKEAEQKDTALAVAAVGAEIEKKSSEVDMLATEVKEIYASIDKIRKSLKDAGKVRKEESNFFKTASKDRTLALKVLKQAKDVLQHFYAKKVSLKQAAPPQPQSSRKKIASGGAVSMLEEITADIAKEQKDAAAQEDKAALAFYALQQQSRDAEDSKHQDVTDRVKAKAKLKVQINGLKETGTETFDKGTSIKKQLISLHKECDELLKQYSQRKKARTFEVSQLRDVMDILSGSSIAARTGLTQAA